MRRRRAEARRAAMVEALDGMGPAAWVFNRGLAGAFARAFGVHHATAWRDLQILFGPGCNYDFYGPGGDFLFTVTRAYGGGPIWAVTDADGNEIRGPRRRAILRHVRRYAGGRR